jgi:hypothetical protein
LKFWDGSAWTSDVPDGEQVKIDDALGNTTVFTPSGIANPSGVIGEFDSLGDLHEHLDITSVRRFWKKPS